MPMDRNKYPANWEAVSLFIRQERAGSRCECSGECSLGQPFGHKERCKELNRQPALFAKGRVVLTTAHLCSCSPLCAEPEHLKAMCQGCHLRFDRYHHARNRRLQRYSYNGPPLPGVAAVLRNPRIPYLEEHKSPGKIKRLTRLAGRCIFPLIPER